MSSEIANLKDAVKSIFLLQRKKSEKTLAFYRKLQEKDPTDFWKFKRETPFYDQLQGLVPQEVLSPVYMLETAIATIDEYVEALDNFSQDQFAAFLLGLGLNWIPLRYWGLKELDNYLARLQKAIAFYEEILSKTPSDLHSALLSLGLGVSAQKYDSLLGVSRNKEGNKRS